MNTAAPQIGNSALFAYKAHEKMLAERKRVSIETLTAVFLLIRKHILYSYS